MLCLDFKSFLLKSHSLVSLAFPGWKKTHTHIHNTHYTHHTHTPHKMKSTKKSKILKIKTHISNTSSTLPSLTFEFFSDNMN